MNGILRPGLLSGVTVLLDALTGSSGGESAPGAAVEPALASLGAQVTPLAGRDAAAVQELGKVHALVLDCSGWAPAGEPPEPLQQLLAHVWASVEAVANGALIPRGEGGRILFIGPSDRARPSAPAAGAALENLARTLSVEWARYGITVCAVSPSVQTSPGDLAAVVAYLLSPAGAYFSGTRLDLDALSG